MRKTSRIGDLKKYSDIREQKEMFAFDEIIKEAQMPLPPMPPTGGTTALPPGVPPVPGGGGMPGGGMGMDPMTGGMGGGGGGLPPLPDDALDSFLDNLFGGEEEDKDNKEEEKGEEGKEDEGVDSDSLSKSEKDKEIFGEEEEKTTSGFSEKPDQVAEIVDALISKKEFWEKLKETVAEVFDAQNLEKSTMELKNTLDNLNKTLDRIMLML